MLSIFEPVVSVRGPGRPLDPNAVRHALALLADPANACQVQSLPGGSHFVLGGNDLDGLVRACEVVNGGWGLYCLLNPVPKHVTLSGASGHATSKDVLCRRWLPIDVDPEREKLTSATAAEKEVARGVMAEVLEHLTQRGWPAPLVLDSGNGFHLLYRVDLAHDRLSQAVLGRFLKALGAAFDTPGAKVDDGSHSPTFQTKLPGSWACKGTHSEDRPHRPVRLLSEPVTLLPVSLAQIADVAGVNLEALAAKQQVPVPTVFTLHPSGANGSGTAYGLAALDKECARVSLAPHGNRAKQLYKSAAALGELVGGGVLPRHTVEQALTLAAENCGLDDDGRMGRNGIANTIRRGIDQGMGQPRGVPPRPQPMTPPDPPVPDGARIIIRASEVTPRRVEFLWPLRIPLGKMTTFAGQGGLGKTFVLCDISARVTRGLEWPHGGGECAEPGQVLFISGEDDLDDTLVPRLIECGADLARVAFLTAEVQDNFTLAALKVLTAALGQIGPDTRLVVIDPPTSYLGGVNDHRNAELRSLLSPLKNWASLHRVAVVFNTHVNKPQGTKVEAMMRVMGSVAWVNAVRAAHMFAKDPDDPTRRLFMPMKSNNAREPKGIAYRLVDTPTLARVEWLGEVETTADDAVNRNGCNPGRVLATDWLVDLFTQKLEWPSTEFWASAKQHNIGRRAIDDARVKLGLPKPRKVTTLGGDDTWTWWAPADWPPLLARQVDRP